MSLTERVHRAETDHARAEGKTAPRRPRRRTAAPQNGKWGENKRLVRNALLEELGPKLYVRRDAAELRAIVASHLDDALRTAGVSVQASQRTKFVTEVAADLLASTKVRPWSTRGSRTVPASTR
jgi:hypothetical protein